MRYCLSGGVLANDVFVMEAVRRLSPPGSPYGTGFDQRLGNRTIEEISIFSHMAYTSTLVSFFKNDQKYINWHIGPGGVIRHAFTPGNEITVKTTDLFVVDVSLQPTASLQLDFTTNIGRRQNRPDDSRFREIIMCQADGMVTCTSLAYDPKDSDLLS